MVVERESQDRSMARAMEPWSREGAQKDEEHFQRLNLTEPARRIVLKERNQWNTHTESCESDETEVEEVMQFRAPPGQSDLLIVTLKEKPGELFKVNAWLREDPLKLKWKWTGKVGENKF